MSEFDAQVGKPLHQRTDVCLAPSTDPTTEAELLGKLHTNRLMRLHEAQAEANTVTTVAAAVSAGGAARLVVDGEPLTLMLTPEEAGRVLDSADERARATLSKREDGVDEVAHQLHNARQDEDAS